MSGPDDGGTAGRASTDDFELAGVPDAFQRLWTPHRLAYITGEEKPRDTGCPFCAAPGRSDEESLIVHRGQTCYVVLNLYPYNPGHVLVNPYRHVADLSELTDAELVELQTLTRAAVEVIRHVAHPSAFNVGLNLGEVAGGSLAAHLHQHVVPRWAGDGNFMPIIAQTKAITQTLGEQWRQLHEAWNGVAAGVTGATDTAAADHSRG
ncbi:hydrolase [Tersicoccus solisilvae]|uniref:Hydrolase n=1 Tax=Tersicoccus solisilvae TaxID=1882339 RepID=A0ABQ1NPH4_9MICC|nr:HIT domain-containing protein [Tersicoccus solisilvae]GGC82277.1 hydrolase [Tersicoccus solisilvae]